MSDTHDNLKVSVETIRRGQSQTCIVKVDGMEVARTHDGTLATCIAEMLVEWPTADRAELLAVDEN